MPNPPSPSDRTPWEPFDRLVSAVAAGRHDAVLYAESDDGLFREMPASLWFRDESEFDALESYAITLCRGHVADIGAGVGPHSLALMRAGLKVTAIDSSTVAVATLRNRGVTDARTGDVMAPPGGPFDTLLLLMNGIGLVGDEANLRRWFASLDTCLKPGGHVLLDTTDLTAAADPETRHGAEGRRRLGRHPGSVMFRLTFDGVSGAPFPWLFATPDEICALADEHGYRAEVVFEEDARSLVRLSR